MKGDRRKEEREEGREAKEGGKIGCACKGSVQAQCADRSRSMYWEVLFAGVQPSFHGRKPIRREKRQTPTANMSSLKGSNETFTPLASGAIYPTFETNGGGP